jgi:hypothetical protein
MNSAAQVVSRFTLANLYMARKLSMPNAEKLRPQYG